METFFLTGLGLIFALVVVCIAQSIGRDAGEIFFDGMYGNTSIGEELREKESPKD